MNRDDLLELSRHPNVAAFLRVIRQAESNQTDDAYRIRWGGSYFEAPPWKHPGTALSANDRTGREISSSAAGAYQFLRSTWEEVARVYQLPDFSPESQDAGAVALIKRANALDDVIAGRLEAAIGKCNRVWAGLPGDRYGQGGISMQTARNAWAKYGGQIVVDATEPPVAHPQTQPEPAAPAVPAAPSGPAYNDFGQPTREEQPVPTPLATAAVSMLFDLVPTLVKEFGSGSSTRERNARVVEKVAEIAQQATKAPTIVQAAEQVATNPAALAAVDQAVRDQWWQLQEAGGGGIAGARKADEQFMARDGRVWKSPAFVVTCLLLPVVYTVVGAVLFGEGWSQEIKASVVSAVISGVLFAIVGYWLGSSLGSATKDQQLRR